VIGYAGSADVARAATYYVSKSGNNTYSCAQAQSVSTPKLSLNSGVACLKPGDTLLVAGGVYAESLSNVPSGTSWTAKVRIAAAPGETVWMRPSSGHFVVNFSGSQQYVEFDGINMDGTSVLSDVVKIDGWSGGNAHHIRFQNADIMGAPVQAVLLTASAPGIIGGNEFINLRVYGTGRTDFDHAFYIQSSSNLIEDCEIYDIPGGAVHIYNGYGHVISNTVVRNNVIRDGRFVSAARGWGVIVANGSTGAKIYNNLVYNIRNTGGTSGGIYVYSGSNTEVYNNTVYGNAAHGIFVENRIGTIVRNNIS
jgi:parallel beta-helix repeat protein